MKKRILWMRRNPDFSCAGAQKAVLGLKKAPFPAKNAEEKY
jgi:hypothetical protein